MLFNQKVDNMPSQIKFTRESILTQAFEIVRQEGLEALSARRIAKELGCSTQPVYNTFASMLELRDAVIEEAKKYSMTYFSQSQELDQTPPFLSLGLRYFQFSQEERPLFELLFLDGLIGISPENIGQPFYSLLGNLKKDHGLQGFPQESLKRLGTNMWVYLHGLTVLFYKSPPDQIGGFIRGQLLEMGKTLIEWEQQQYIQKDV
jgi:AcrR family transcriptional regulator